MYIQYVQHCTMHLTVTVNSSVSQMNEWIMFKPEAQSVAKRNGDRQPRVETKWLIGSQNRKF